MKGEKIYIISDGKQIGCAPNEIIDVIPAAHWRKIVRRISGWDSEPICRLGSKHGERIIIDYYPPESPRCGQPRGLFNADTMKRL